MKLWHYALCFIALMIIPLVTTFSRITKTDKVEKQSRTCEYELSESLLGSLEAIENVSNGKYIFQNKKDRQKAITTFYDVLSTNLGHTLLSDEFNDKDVGVAIRVSESVPALFLVDTDGYYVCYRQYENGFLQTHETPLNTWSDYISPSGDKIIRYFLDDYVEVIIRTSGVISENSTFTYKGKREDVYKNIQSRFPSPSVFDEFIGSDEIYAQKRSECISKIMENELHFYVNTYNVDESHVYKFEIPNTIKDELGKQIDQPCTFALLKGEYFGLSKHNANIYAFSNAEVIDNTYYLSEKGGEMYHDRACSDVNSGNCELCTIRECAKKGQEPHTCVR